MKFLWCGVLHLLHCHMILLESCKVGVNYSVLSADAVSCVDLLCMCVFVRMYVCALLCQGGPRISEAERRKQRELVAKEIEKLQSGIQALCRSTAPLGKIVDYVQVST